MYAVSTRDLLAAWDLGQARQPAERALALLAAACPGTAPGELEKLTIGERDARLLQMRELIFGPQLLGLADCLKCGERLELDFDAGEVVASGNTAVPSPLEVGGYRVDFRLPGTHDLSASGAASGIPEARAILLRRCVTVAFYEGQPVPPEGVPESIVEAVSDAMERADPQCNVQLALECPGCGASWEEVFDIASFLWAEVHAWAVRVFRDVHQLASAYGWGESEIIEMSPWRRQLYLEMLSG